MRQFVEDVLTEEAVAAYAADWRKSCRAGPEQQGKYEGWIRHAHAEDTVARQLRKVPTEEYVRAGLGSPKRISELYIQAETLCRSGHLPQPVWQAMNQISWGFLGALASVQCDTEEAIQAKSDAIVFQVAADEDLEIDSTFAEFAREILEARNGRL